MKEVSEHIAGEAARAGLGAKALVRSFLDSRDFEEALQTAGLTTAKIINLLLGFLFETNELARCRAVRGLGLTVSALARKDLDAAREIMRRLMWSLNDESGGIGWGAPEAMGEIMAENENLALEYHRILVSYIDEHGNPLENDLLERGVMWGICRLAQKRPRLLLDWTGPIVAQLKSCDPVKRALALKTLLWLAPFEKSHPQPEALAALLAPLLDDPAEVRTFQDGSFVHLKIGAMAGELLGRLRCPPEPETVR